VTAESAECPWRQSSKAAQWADRQLSTGRLGSAQRQLHEFTRAVDRLGV